MHSGSSPAWADGSTNQATAYLWIPENCRRLRGLLILCANVPEHMLVGHPAIRAVCSSNDLGIVWCAPSFMNFRKDMPKDYRTATAFLQQILDGLARKSGYDEVATVPWLPMGESGHLLMVDALVEQCPERCLAGIWIKNNHLPPKNRTVPALVAFGTAQEWSQTKSDIRTNWNNIGAAYAGILDQRAKNPGWPLSYIIDGSSGHFDCSERLAQYFAHYIDLVAKARLAVDGTLKPVSLETGFLADLPVPGHEPRSAGVPPAGSGTVPVPVPRTGGETPPEPAAETAALPSRRFRVPMRDNLAVEAAPDNHSVTAFAATAPDARGVPWYFDRTSAEDAQAFARINWQA